MKVTTLVLVLFVIVLIGAAIGAFGVNQREVNSSDRLELSVVLGKNANAYGIVLTPKRVNDTRCPIGSECVKKGEARIVTSISYLNGNREIEIGTEGVAVGPYMVYLVDITPHPRLGIKIPVEDYRVTFVVTKVD